MGTCGAPTWKRFLGLGFVGTSALVLALGLATRAEADPPKPACPAGFVRVPAGAFDMGSGPSEGENDERPRHKVSVGDFCLQRTEATTADYGKCIQRGECSPTGTDKGCNGGVPGRGNHPVNCIDRNQAEIFCRSIGARLPTEAEWEYAARGTDGRAFPWGSAAPSEKVVNACGEECVANARAKFGEEKHALYTASDGFPETAPVGSFPQGASPFGLLDMAGNVYEWTSSHYCRYPQHDCASRFGVYRGGGWYSVTPASLAATTRGGALPNATSVAVGVRCAL